MGRKFFRGLNLVHQNLLLLFKERLQRRDDTPRFEEESDAEGELLEQLDRLEELESIVENAKNAIDAAKSKTLILSMTFTNR